MSEYPGLPRTTLRAFKDLLGPFLIMLIPFVVLATVPVLVLSQWSPRGASFAVLALVFVFYRSSLRRSLNREESKKSEKTLTENAQMTGVNVLIVSTIVGVIFTSGVALLGAIGGLTVDYLAELTAIQPALSGALGTVVALSLPVLDAKIGNRDIRFSLLGQITIRTFQILGYLKVLELEDANELGKAALSYTH